ncbi:casein kinase 2 regulatory subunit [Tieghemiomyces parasiticus]|uniref:Casein kinase II subunit beta n=1 Tax=Tieghemiomyces parasiticus TaxID=78921 RepID=A0A9W8ACC5_9FUNG|nr:casein kinase 2 regulatory subunit [Tieghemiomyces parasiticus]KAJ1930306.1 casein kinase 2 regulatory subunit [Tieghemiomyces parasiticus]
MLDDSNSEGDYARYWAEWFLYLKGNEYFVEIDEDYIADRFNLTGLNSEVEHYQAALQMIADDLDESALDEATREVVDRSARHLYGLIHARYVITSRGMQKVLEKYKTGGFGRCPRVLCNNQSLLPVGLTDVPGIHPVKLYCPHCQDIYNPKSARHAAIDGAYFGSSLPHMIFQTHPSLIPTKSAARYEPKIFGFKVHEIAEAHRWQDKARAEKQERLEKGVTPAN